MKEEKQYQGYPHFCYGFKVYRYRDLRSFDGVYLSYQVYQNERQG